MRGIWSEDSFSFRGDFYRFAGYTMRPKPLGPTPEIFQGGSSRAARDMAARVSDWYFTNGNTPEGLAAQADDLRARAAEQGRSVRVGINAFAVVRDTEAGARAVVDDIVAQADGDAVRAFGHEAKNAGHASPEGKGNWADSTFADLVQYNDGFRSNLIGTPRQVAERIVALKRAGARPDPARFPPLSGGGGVFRSARHPAGAGVRSRGAARRGGGVAREVLPCPTTPRRA